MFPFRDHNPSQRTPYVTIALIAVNVIVFLMMLPAYSDPFTMGMVLSEYALFPVRISEGSGFYTLLTSAFMHGGFMHLAGNMLFLWVFGDNLEDQMGHGPFALFYAAAAVLAGLAQVMSDPQSIVPMVGASGAVAGVMGGYLLLFPKARVDVFFFFVIFFRIFPIPAWIVLGVWFALQLFNGTSVGAMDGGVAYWAHAGGFIAGLVMTIPVWIASGGKQFWVRAHGHTPHPEAKYRLSQSNIPIVRRKRR